MIFKDRSDAGKQLAKAILKDDKVMAERNRLAVVSLVRGGVMVGHEVASQLRVPHFFLVVAKISHPENEELAIGALCGSDYFLDDQLVKKLQISEDELEKQLGKARNKLEDYLKKFIQVPLKVKNKIVILVDDGVATGSSVGAARVFLKNKGADKIILTIPVAPDDFTPEGFDQVIILHRAYDFRSVSQFFTHFPQIKTKELVKMARSN